MFEDTKKEGEPWSCQELEKLDELVELKFGPHCAGAMLDRLPKEIEKVVWERHRMYYLSEGGPVGWTVSEVDLKFDE